MDRQTLERIVRRALHKGTNLDMSIRLNEVEIEKVVADVISNLEHDKIIKATYSKGDK